METGFVSSGLGTLPIDTSFKLFYTASSGGSDLRTITEPINKQNWKSYAEDRDIVNEFIVSLVTPAPP